MFDSAAFSGQLSSGCIVLADRLMVAPYFELVFVLESSANADEAAADLVIELVGSAAHGDVTCLSASLRLIAANVRPGVATATVKRPHAELRIASRWLPREPPGIAPIRGVLFGRIASPQA